MWAFISNGGSLSPGNPANWLGFSVICGWYGKENILIFLLILQRERNAGSDNILFTLVLRLLLTLALYVPHVGGTRGSRKFSEASGLGSIINFKRKSLYIVLDFYHEIIHVH